MSGLGQELVIVDAIRTARGRGSDKGSLKSLMPVSLLGQTLGALASRNRLHEHWSQVSDVLIGCVTQTGAQGANVAKLALIEAGWPDAIPAATINRYCTSSLSALGYAALRCAAEDRVCVAGGVEMMSSVPMASDQGLLTHDLNWTTQHGLVNIGLAADAVASMEGFDRAAVDEYALRSQQLASQHGKHMPSRISVRDETGHILLDDDETPRPGTTRESLAALEPAFARYGQKTGQAAFLSEKLGLRSIAHVHTAGNSPATADGASAVLLATRGAAARLGMRARAKLLSCCEVATDRLIALTGAVEASRRALNSAGLRPEQIDLFEINESFAALMLHYVKHLGIPLDKLNVNGGAIALGHAMGSTGTALVSNALDELERRQARYALVSACGATGLATAVLIERMDH
jgi:acetyl-CoA C-acetyltransferase